MRTLLPSEWFLHGLCIWRSQGSTQRWPHAYVSIETWSYAYIWKFKFNSTNIGRAMRSVWNQLRWSPLSRVIKFQRNRRPRWVTCSPLFNSDLSWWPFPGAFIIVDHGRRSTSVWQLHVLSDGLITGYHPTVYASNSFYAVVTYWYVTKQRPQSF